MGYKVPFKTKAKLYKQLQEQQAAQLRRIIGKNYDSIKFALGLHRSDISNSTLQDAERAIEHAKQKIQEAKELRADLKVEGFPADVLGEIDKDILFAYKFIVRAELAILSGYYDNPVR